MEHFRERFEKEISEASDSILEQILKVLFNYGEDAALQAVYNSLEAMNQASGIDEKTSCSKGCSFCCHDEIIISSLEAKRIKRLASSFEPDKSVLSKQKNASNFKELKWNDKKCSLLNPDGTCSIYENRPMICRTHNSEDDPKNCDQSKEEKTHRQLYAIGIEAMQVALLRVNSEEITSLHKIL